MKDILDLIFVNYWSQIVLLLGIIGYLLKVFIEKVWLEPRNKTSEIQRSIFFLNKYEGIEALNTYAIEFEKTTSEIFTSSLFKDTYNVNLYTLHQEAYENLVREAKSLEMYASESEVKILKNMIKHANMINHTAFMIKHFISTILCSKDNQTDKNNKTFNDVRNLLEASRKHFNTHLESFKRAINKTHY